MKEYIKKPIPVKAKIFEIGDESGFIKNENGVNIPFVETLEGRELQGTYGNHYIVFGNHGDKWLVKKDIFEDTYQEIKN